MSRALPVHLAASSADLCSAWCPQHEYLRYDTQMRYTVYGRSSFSRYRFYKLDNPGLQHSVTALHSCFWPSCYAWFRSPLDRGSWSTQPSSNASHEVQNTIKNMESSSRRCLLLGTLLPEQRIAHSAPSYISSPYVFVVCRAPIFPQSAAAGAPPSILVRAHPTGGRTALESGAAPTLLRRR